MKKNIFVALAVFCVYATSCDQGKTPTTVINSFNQKFPNARSISWDKENTHEYEASFIIGKDKYSANFSDSGEWLETESPYTFEQLPEKVKKSFKDAHNGKTIKTVAKIEMSTGVTKYEIEFKQGIKIMELFYSNEGQLLK